MRKPIVCGLVAVMALMAQEAFATGQMLTIPAVENVGTTLSTLLSADGSLASILAAACLVSGGVGYVMERNIRGMLLGAVAGVIIILGLTALTK